MRTGLRALRAGGWLGLVRNTGWLLSGKTVGAILSFFYLGLATRSLGPTGFGQFTLVLGTAQAIATLVTFESWQLLVRYGMPRLRAHDGAGLGRLIAFCVTLDLGGAVVGCLIAVGAIAVLTPVFDWSADLREQALLFCFVLLLCTRSAATGVLRLHDRFGAAAFAETVTPVLRLFGALVVVWQGATVIGLLAAWAVADIVTALVYWRGAIQTVPVRQWHWRGVAAVPAEIPGLWRYAAMVNATATLGLVGRQLAVLMVGAWVGPAAAGGYRLAHQLGQALANITDMMSRATFSELMRTRAGQTAAELAQLFRRASLIALITATVMVVLVLLAGPTLLGLLAGPGYDDAVPLLMLLGVAAALDAAGVSFEPALIATDRAWLALRLRMLSTALLLAGLVLLLSEFGPIGAAAATAIASALTLLLLGTAAWRAIHAPQPKE